MAQEYFRHSPVERLRNGHTWAPLVLSAVFIFVWQASPGLSYQGLASYLPLHIALETFSIVISFLIFGVVWNAYTRERASSLIILACVFFAVGAIDFLHTLSFKGMPDFVTPSDPEKAINFWLAARYLAAAGLLGVAIFPWRPMTEPRLRYVWLAGALAVVGLVAWLGLYQQADLPRTFIEGTGLTPLKIGAEYLLVGLFAASAILFYRRKHHGTPYDAASLFNAAAISILSELCFTLYSDVTDIFNLLGHIYKVIAYGFIYRAVFVESVHAPFRLVQEAEARYHAVVEDMPVLICRFLPDGTLTYVNQAYCLYFGKTPQELIGHSWMPLVPEEDKAYVKTQFGSLTQDKPVVTYEHRVIIPSGEIRWQRWTDRAVFDANRLVEYQSIGEDITERKRAESALHQAEERYRSIFAGARDGIVLLDANTGRVVDCNPEFERQCGRPLSELKQFHIWELRPIDKQEAARRKFDEVKQVGQGRASDLELLQPNGTIVPIEFMATRIHIGEHDYIQSMCRDITERKQNEAAVRASRDLLRSVLENIPIRVFWKDRALRYLGCNSLFARDAGMTQAEELIGKDDFQMGWHEQAELYRADDQRVMDSDTAKLGFEEPQTTPDGHTIWLRTWKVPLHDAEGKAFGVLGIYDDITEQRHVAEALKRSEASLSEAQHIAQLGSWELDFGTNQLRWSDETYRIFEIEPTAFAASYEAFLAATHPDDRGSVAQAFTEHVNNRAPYDIVHRLLTQDGRIKYVRERCETTYAGEKPLRSVGTVQDITEQKLADLALQRVNRTLRTLSAGNEVLVRADDETGLLHEMCRVIVENGGYRIAWVGYAERDAAKTVRPVAQFGAAADYLENLHVNWNEDNIRGRGPTGTAIRTRRPALARDILVDPAFAPWREAALQHGFAASIALPLLEGEHILGTLNIYAAESNAFDREEVALLTELASDLSYGIVNLRIRGQQAQAEARLRESLVSTIRAIALTVEMRDPYTAGHQNKVADICMAIGKELGWPEDRLEGLRLGATIHDIGKINVPAEILNRPGRLSSPEFEIIKSHPSTGYEIVKDIAFPWPVAEMILQHHERLDGSGYPRGIKGDAIIPEARILCAADVLDAMASHRPYRPGLGKQAALDELKRGRGILYDPVIVDACIKLYRDADI